MIIIPKTLKMTQNSIKTIVPVELDSYQLEAKNEALKKDSALLSELTIQSNKLKTAQKDLKASIDCATSNIAHAGRCLETGYEEKEHEIQVVVWKDDRGEIMQAGLYQRKIYEVRTATQENRQAYFDGSLFDCNLDGDEVDPNTGAIHALN